MRIIIDTDATGTAQVAVPAQAAPAHDAGPVPAELLAMAGENGASARTGVDGESTAAPEIHDGGPPPDALLQRARGGAQPGLPPA